MPPEALARGKEWEKGGSISGDGSCGPGNFPGEKMQHPNFLLKELKKQKRR